MFKNKVDKLAGNGFVAVRRVRTEHSLLDQIPNLRLLNFWGFVIGYEERKKMTCYFEPR